MAKFNEKWINEYVKNIFKSGAVIVSHGMRGGGKTHCAISFSQRLIEGYYPDTPKHVILITNVIFVHKNNDGEIETKSPKNVYTIHQMGDVFPIVADFLEKYGRNDTLIILLLDEAQNFLLGDMNNKGDMASSMKSFCGILRKFNICLWLLSPTMRNLGPAFRNFLDNPTDSGNVNTTFQKNNKVSEKFIKAKHLNMDYRSLVFVKTGFNERVQMLPVPTSEWTQNPETMPVGGYAYDNLSSADFTIGTFPFHDFVLAISGVSSYDMLKAIRGFYEKITNGDDPTQPINVDQLLVAYRLEIFGKCYDAGITEKQLSEIFGVSSTTVTTWKKKLGKDIKNNKPAVKKELASAVDDSE